MLTLAQEAEQRRREIEAARNLPTDLIARAKAEGLVRMWTAKAYGGLQLGVRETMQRLQPIAYHNASLAWVLAVTNCSSLFSGYFPSEMATQLYSDKNAMIGGFAGPVGVAQITDGGIQVSGQWSWGSGIRHCSHIVGGARFMQGEQMVGAALAFFLPEEIELEDNWHVVGLKGTNSINYRAENVFIPNGRWSFFPLSEAQIDAPLYRFSSLGALSLSVAVVGLGLAERAVHEIQAIAQAKSPMGQGKPLAKRSVSQQAIGKIYGNYWGAHSLFYNTIAKAEAEAAKGACSAETKAAIRLAACHTTHLAKEVVQEAYRIAGGSAVWEAGKLEELHRDMHVVSQHAMVADANYRTAGAVFLGNRVPEFLL